MAPVIVTLGLLVVLMTTATAVDAYGDQTFFDFSRVRGQQPPSRAAEAESPYRSVTDNDKFFYYDNDEDDSLAPRSNSLLSPVSKEAVSSPAEEGIWHSRPRNEGGRSKSSKSHQEVHSLHNQLAICH